MTDQERIDLLERMVFKMADALRRKDTEQDGNWGHQTFYGEMVEIQDALSPRKRARQR